MASISSSGPFVSRVMVSWDEGPPDSIECGSSIPPDSERFVTKILVSSHVKKKVDPSEQPLEADMNSSLYMIDAANYITSLCVNKEYPLEEKANYDYHDEENCDSLDQNVYSDINVEDQEQSESESDIYEPIQEPPSEMSQLSHKKIFRVSTSLERNDSGLGADLHQPLRRLSLRQKQQDWCWDCDSPIQKAKEEAKNGLCETCSKRRSQRREAVAELLESELRYSRDLRLIQEEFHRPMLAAGLVNHGQALVLFSNISDLLRHSVSLITGLRRAIGRAAAHGDVDLMTVCVGRLVLEHAAMLPAFRHYCSYAGEAFKLLGQLDTQGGPVQTFLRTSQRDNPLLRRMGLHAFLMVPIQRVTKYPLLMQRISDATPSWHTEASRWLDAAKALLQHHLQAIDEAVGRLQSCGKGTKPRTKSKT